MLEHLTDFQGMTAHGLGVLRGIDREQLLQKTSSRSIGREGREMRLKPNQLRCRPAI